MAQSQSWQGIPTHLTFEQFEKFVLPHLHIGSRGPQPKLDLHVLTGVEGSVATPSAPQIRARQVSPSHDSCCRSLPGTHMNFLVLMA
jgi:hypothetical protein